MTHDSPSRAFAAASWIALGVGVTGFVVGLTRAELALNEKGYYAFAFSLAIFGAIAVRKNTRDGLAAA